MLLANKLIEKIPDPRNAKEYYQLFMRKKNTKSAKQSEIITYQPKSFENPNIVNIKSVIIEHPKTSHKLPKAIRYTEKFFQVLSLYTDIKNGKLFKQKKCKNSKTNTCFKRFCNFL